MAVKYIFSSLWLLLYLLLLKHRVCGIEYRRSLKALGTDMSENGEVGDSGALSVLVAPD